MLGPRGLTFSWVDWDHLNKVLSDFDEDRSKIQHIELFFPHQNFLGGGGGGGGKGSISCMSYHHVALCDYKPQYINTLVTILSALY